MTRRVLTGLIIDKVAAVDRPCQEHATANIFKRDYTAAQRREAAASGAAMPGGEYPIQTTSDLHDAIQAFGRAKDKAATRAHIITRAKALGASDQLPEDWSTSKQESIMLKELAKALGLPETATEAEVTKAVADGIAKSATAAAALTKAQEDLAATTAALEKATKKPPMEPDADDEVAKGLAFKTSDGVVIRKAKVGDEVFLVLKAQNDQLVKVNEDLAKAKDDAANVDFAKRATDIGFGADFAPTLRKAYSGDAVAQAEIEKRIVGLQKQAEAGGLFSNFGKNSPKTGSAEEELMAKVAEVKKANPKLKPAQAYTKAYTDPENADIVKRVKEEAAA